MDTDGQALHFLEFVPLKLSDRQEIPCEPSLDRLHDAIALALHGNEWWEASSETTIVLTGTNLVILKGGRGSD